MSTVLQKSLADEIIKNSRAKTKKNKRELLVSAGYDETTAKATPQRTISQKGVQSELISLGFTEEKAKAVVAEILEDKYQEAGERLRAADMVFKVHGSYAPEKKISATVDINELHAQIAQQIQLFQGTTEPQNE